MATITKDQLVAVYIERNLSKEETAYFFNITMHSLSKLLKNYNIVKDKEKIKSLRQQTCLEKYGVDNPSKNSEIAKRIVTTNLTKYGAKSYTATAAGKNKVAETKEKRYGDCHYNNYEQGKLTKKVRYNNENYNNRNKYKETMLDKYGVDNGFKLPELIDNNIKAVVDRKGYNPIVYELFSDKNKFAEFLKGKDYSYYDLSHILNMPYYAIQQNILRNNLSEYISKEFKGKSHYEDEICDYLLTLGITNIEKNSKNLLHGLEIDLYLPDYKVGIEFNGNFWHSDLYKKNTYHFDKSILAQENGIHLIHIYQYEWDNPLTQAKIKNFLQITLYKVNKKIYARDCTVKVITNKEAKVLNNKNHLQNHRNAKVTYGLFYHDELVQLMSFSPNKKYQWEIIRGCPGSNNIVVGGVSKLFKHFVRDYDPESVFSYCDFNKFNGKSYEALGMEFIGYTGPDMRYIIKGQVVNRQPSRYKEIKSQIEARLYGAGSKKYLWRRKTA